MAFFKKMKKKINGKWYLQSVTVGKPVTTDEFLTDCSFEVESYPAATTLCNEDSDISI